MSCKKSYDDFSTEKDKESNAAAINTEDLIISIERLQDLSEGKNVVLQVENRTDYDIYNIDIFVSYPISQSEGLMWNPFSVLAEKGNSKLDSSNDRSFTVYLPNILNVEKVNTNYIQMEVQGFYIINGEEVPFDKQITQPLN